MWITVDYILWKIRKKDKSSWTGAVDSVNWQTWNVILWKEDIEWIQLDDSPEFTDVKITTLWSDSWFANTAKSVLDYITKFVAYYKTTLNDVKDLTWFVDPDNVWISYDNVNRTITLTHSSGKIEYYYIWQKKSLTSPWTSSAHLNTPWTSFYLKSTDWINFVWSNTIWSFYDMQVAYVRWAPSPWEYYGIRECHGLMPWMTHEELHATVWTYRESGLDIPVWTILINPANNAATNAWNRPSVNSWVIKDEDCRTVIPAVPENWPYTLLYFDASWNPVLTSNDVDIYKSIWWVLQYNLIGTWLVPVSSNNYINMWSLHIPVTSDAHSQKYRTIWVVWQKQYTTLASAQAADPASLNFGALTGTLPEQILYSVITFQYNTAISSANVVGRCKIAANIRYLQWNRLSLVSGTPAVTSHWSLSNVFGAWTGIVDWHISDQSQTIAWLKSMTEWIKLEKEITGKQITTPANPASGYNKLYFKNDDKLYKLTPWWVETEVGWWTWWGSVFYETSIDWQIYTGTIARYTVQTAQTLAWVKISLWSLPTGANVRIAIRKNSTTTNDIITAWYAEITTGQSATNWIYTTTVTTLDATNKVLAENDVIYVIVIQAGSTLPWSDLYCKIY